jgi:hypothetical protein
VSGPEASAIALTTLRRLGLTGAGVPDLRPLAGRSGPKVLITDHVHPLGGELPGPGSAVVVSTPAEVDSLS